MSRRTSDPPYGLVVRSLRAGGDELVVFSWTVDDAPRLPESAPLTESERAVGQLLLEGHTDAEIAARRGTSTRTVSKQVASVYRKLGVSSRRELWALCRGGAPS